MTENIPLSKCSMELDDVVTCSLTKTKFDSISNKGIKPKKVVFEIE